MRTGRKEDRKEIERKERRKIRGKKSGSEIEVRLRIEGELRNGGRDKVFVCESCVQSQEEG